MTYNKQKGKRVEREAAEIMEDLTGFEWKRTVFSGAMSSHRDNKVYKGDIHCTDDDSLWSTICVEVKGRKDSIKLQELFNFKSKFLKYVEQANRQSGENDYWILLIKVNYEGWFLATNFLHYLPETNPEDSPLQKPEDENTITVNNTDRQRYSVMRLDQ